MPKKVPKVRPKLIFLALVVWVLAYFSSQPEEVIGEGEVVWSVIVIAALVILFKVAPKWTRRTKLMKKYNDSQIVNLIMGRSFWQGQTKEQVIDSLGNPEDIDEKVMKTKTKETWKYNHLGGNRYGLRIMIEDGEVVGWDKKD